MAPKFETFKESRSHPGRPTIIHNLAKRNSNPVACMQDTWRNFSKNKKKVLHCNLHLWNALPSLSEVKWEISADYQGYFHYYICTQNLIEKKKLSGHGFKYTNEKKEKFLPVLISWKES